MILPPAILAQATPQQAIQMMQAADRVLETNALNIVAQSNGAIVQELSDRRTEGNLVDMFNKVSVADEATTPRVVTPEVKPFPLDGWRVDSQGDYETLFSQFCIELERLDAAKLVGDEKMLW